MWTFPPLWRIHLLVMHGKRHTNFKVQYVKTKKKVSGWEVNYSDQNVKKWQFWGRHANQLATALLAEHSTRAPRSQSAPLAAQLTEYLANGSYSRRQLAVTPPPFSFRVRPVLTYCTFNSRVFWMSLRDNSTAHYPPSFKVQIKEHKKKTNWKTAKRERKKCQLHQRKPQVLYTATAAGSSSILIARAKPPRPPTAPRSLLSACTKLRTTGLLTGGGKVMRLLACHLCGEGRM